MGATYKLPKRFDIYFPGDWRSGPLGAWLRTCVITA